MIQKITTLLLLLLLFACSSTSMEFRSAKSAARAEKDLQRGEEWALKALNMDMEKDNALIPYFLATEIYKPQERWEDMASMLDEAVKRNPGQKLEKPIILDAKNITKDNILLTIEQGVGAHREEAWVKLFNQAIELTNAGEDEVALGKLILCLKIDSSQPQTYSALVSYYAEKNDLKAAQNYVDQGLKANKSAALYEIKAKLLLSDFATSGNKSLLAESESMYLKAMELLSSDTDAIDKLKKQLIFVYIDMDQTQKAIDISTALLEKYYDDPDLYFNAAVLYQRLAKQLYEPAADLYNSINSGESASNESIKQLYADFIQSKKYATESKQYFLDANDMEIEDTGSREAAMEMRNLIKSLDTFISSTKSIAADSGINLD